jgi:hypothetical protein
LKALNAFHGTLKTEHVPIPQTTKDIESNPFREEWIQAMREELSSLKAKVTYIRIPRHEATSKPFPLRWVFSLKQDAFGNVLRFKARLVGKGYLQVEGVDYDQTTSPVSDYITLRILLALSVILGLCITAMDIKTAYLNAYLDNVRFTEQPEYFHDGTDYVWLLEKALYGLKQAAKQWNDHITNKLLELDFKQLRSDRCLFVHGSGDSLTMLMIWVDDILIASKTKELADIHSQNILKLFDGKIQPNEVEKSFLGWRMTITEGCIKVNQNDLIDDLLK